MLAYVHTDVWGDSKKQANYNLGRGPSPETDPAGILILDASLYN
jgi:hypothetical protein